jgi:hypothetical protein
VRARWLSSLGSAIRKDSCGCVTGAIFLGIALAATSIWHAFHWHAATLAPWSTAGQMFGQSIAASILGKLVGLLLHKTRTREENIRSAGAQRGNTA